MSNPNDKVTIVGGGIVGVLEAYFAYKEAMQQSKQIRVTIYEKNEDLSKTTTSNIVPSLTPDEILSVVPRGAALVEKLGLLFSEPGGIRVDDVSNVNGTEVANLFISEVQSYSIDEEGHKKRTQALLKLGKRSMELWQQMYDEADPDLQQIMRDSNFNPCREPHSDKSILHDGYRIDLIYNVPNAKKRAEGMQADYEGIGYKSCKILTPDEVEAMDPALAEFCAANSTQLSGARVWKNDATALFRPGGCIDTAVFLPKFYAYLQKVMGTYTNASGVTKNCFRIKFNSEVDGVKYAAAEQPVIDGLHFASGRSKTNKHAYQTSDYVFCPGEAVGTLSELGFVEPAYAGFAGSSLRLRIPVPSKQLVDVSDFNHCMEVHQEGVVLAWQARCIGDQIFIGVAGTKAFYADQTPNIDQDFARNRNLLQLNMINDVLPQFIGMALGRDTRGQKLTEADLNILVDKGIAKRWVGTRAVAYDGFPTLGDLYVLAGDESIRVQNARTTTHLGSGGGSFGPAAVVFSRAAADLNKPESVSAKSYHNDPFVSEIAQYSSSERKATLKV